ncbi:MAG TPA: cupredoxin domain-containing protein [Candidatus Binatia bacterium]|nr:cupredoxin domain-containing protein [Candidatus Binatia bacterium]
MKRLLALLCIAVFLVACSKPAPEPAPEPVNESPFINAGYHEITISNYQYTPKSLTVHQGDRVKWINNMPFVKSVWIWAQDPSPVIRPGKSWSYIFNDVGFYRYRDQFTQDMEGNITVLPYENKTS